MDTPFGKAGSDRPGKPCVVMGALLEGRLHDSARVSSVAALARSRTGSARRYAEGKHIARASPPLTDGCDPSRGTRDTDPGRQQGWRRLDAAGVAAAKPGWANTIECRAVGLAGRSACEPCGRRPRGAHPAGC